MNSNSKKQAKSTGKGKQSQKRNQGQRPGQRAGQRKVRVQSQKAPVALGNKTFQSKPRIRNIGENILVSHSEYVGDITGSTSAFAVASSFALNPGLAASFPWLNQIASRYESYKFKKLVFRFMTERPTTESGYIALVSDYDPSDPQPSSKSNAFQYESTAKAAPWENLVQVNLPRNLLKRKSYYVRQGALTASENISFYDTGNLYVCVGGNSGAVTLGELWCDYEVEFDTPQIDSNVSNGFDSMKLVGATAQTAALPFGTGGVITSSRNAIATYDSVAGTLTFLLPYEGLAVFDVTGTTISAVSTVGSTATVAITSNINGAATRVISYARVTASPGQLLDFSLTAATITGAELRMGPYAAVLL